jgi:hypothetical protein
LKDYSTTQSQVQTGDVVNTAGRNADLCSVSGPFLEMVFDRGEPQWRDLRSSRLSRLKSAVLLPYAEQQNRADQRHETNHEKNGRVGVMVHDDARQQGKE